MVAEQTRLVIRPMGIADLTRVIEIDRQSFAMPWSEQTYRYELTRNQAANLFVAELGGQIVGFIGTWQVLDECHVSTLAVDARYRRRGIAKRLLDYAFDQARIKGVRLATLEVRVSNESAIQLYRQFGFEVTGRRKAYYRDNGEDALIMSAKIIDLVKEVVGESVGES